MRRALPTGLYGILDVDLLGEAGVIAAASAFRPAGVVQLRAKGLSARQMVALAREVKAALGSNGPPFLINDRADVAAIVGADGVHLGQDDITPAAARAILGPDAIVGLSTHSVAQAITALDVDYVAIGPVFPTRTKRDAEPVVGLDGVRAVRAQVRCPLVAIGGIDLERAPAVRAAGADLVAMIGALLIGDVPRNVALALERCR